MKIERLCVLLAVISVVRNRRPWIAAIAAVLYCLPDIHAGETRQVYGTPP